MKPLTRAISTWIQKLYWRAITMRVVRRPMTTLLIGLTHQLRNSLTPMKIIIDSALQSEVPRNLSRADLALLNAQIIRLEELAQTFQDYCLPVVPQLDLVDLRRIVENAVRHIIEAHAYLGIQIIWDAPSKPYNIFADERLLRRSLIIILTNAVDAVQDAGIIWVTLSAASPWIVTEVADNGAGLAPDVQPMLFEPFISNKEAGIGLNLPICRQIIEAHGGMIDARARPGGGTIFRLRMRPRNR